MSDIAILSSCFSCVACAIIASRKGRSPILWAAFGVMLAVVAVLLVTFLPARHKKATPAQLVEVFE